MNVNLCMFRGNANRIEFKQVQTATGTYQKASFTVYFTSNYKTKEKTFINISCFNNKFLLEKLAKLAALDRPTVIVQCEYKPYYKKDEQGKTISTTPQFELKAIDHVVFFDTEGKMIDQHLPGVAPATTTPVAPANFFATANTPPVGTAPVVNPTNLQTPPPVVDFNAPTFDPSDFNDILNADPEF